MNIILKDLISKIGDAKDSLDTAESDRDSFLMPILQVLGITRGGVSSCHTDRDKLRITISGSCRGLPWDNDYIFPVSIFEADDPIAAANAYVGLQAKQKADAERARKLAELARLQKELLT